MASYAAVKIRIADEIERYLNVASWLREAIENELNASYGVKDGAPPKCGVDSKSVTKFKDAVQAFSTLTDAKIRLDKNAKAMADGMTADEERQAVSDYVRSLPPVERGLFLRQELDYHTKAEK